ncbi:thiamine-phosphate kinase [Granulicella sp. WH15]|uniref:thiamine-phosphate kinase n=1 Tax=Granulicella sp. WH15 TaxID=2602070 RepID=UPI001366B963|nr:thiamine-phosphate kinase [Granulicella sp. WH15]QHN04347.1 thiamine-phosphate kinase [Granulicella sp. WH15]
MTKPPGELDLIRQIQSGTRPSVRVPLGIGDDCAILRPPPRHDVLVTTDFTLEGRHFRRDTHSPESAGHRTLARGLSDLAAMGATPLAAFLSLALPRELLSTASGRTWFARYLAGLQTLAATHGVTLAGGDTSQSPSPHILADIVLTGTAPRGRALRRSTAQAGDNLYVTGSLGGAAAELERLFAHPPQRKPTSGDHPQLFPAPRLAMGQALLRRRLATACMDLSDGLSTDLTHLCEASGIRAEILATALPMHPQATIEQALNGGEDYELLFTASSTTRVPRKIAGISITRIGRVLPVLANTPRITLIDQTGKPTAVAAAGWQHLAEIPPQAKSKT